MSADPLPGTKTVEELERELAEMQAAHRELEDAAEALRRESADTVREMAAALDRQRALYENAIAVASAGAAIRASNTGRLAAAVERLRLGLRGFRMSWRGRGAGGARFARVPAAVRQSALGVNVAGYISAESGLGEATRAAIHALEIAGIPVALNNLRGPQRALDRTYTKFTDAHPHPFNLIHLNADNMAAFAGCQGRSYFRDRYSIGFWFWELDAFRDDWRGAFRHVDEVWVASEHTRRAVGQRAPVPVVSIPLGIEMPECAPHGRAHFGLPEQAFVFMCVFDVSSQMERKNPFAVIRAFRLAGFAHDQAVLVLKFTNGHTNRGAVRRLADAASGLNVVMIDGVMERRELGALVRCCDSYVSLHRAEGYGMTIAEAMALGKPVVATDYSANVEFMTDEVSRLVKYRLVTLARDFGPYLRGFRWAEPDVEHAAAVMRELADDPTRAADLGERGQRHVLEVLSPERTARLMKARLEAIRSGRRDSLEVTPSFEVSDRASA